MGKGTVYIEGADRTVVGDPHGAGRTDAASIDALRAEIERTRDRAGQTFQALYERLAPERLKAMAQDKLREAAMDKARNVARHAGESARSFGRNAFQASNLLPAALIGVGVYWLRRNWGEAGNGYDRERYDEQPGEYRYVGTEPTYGTGPMPGAAPTYGYEEAGTRVGSQGYYGEMESQREFVEGDEMGAEGKRDTAGRLREGVSGLRERAGDIASQASQRVRRTTEEVRERAGHYVERTRQLRSTARHRSRELRHRGGRLLEEYPLEMTGAVFAFGVLAGLLMPSTRREDELLGEVRDDVVERAKETGRETVEKLQHVGQETLESAKGAMEREGLAERGTLEKAQDTAARTAGEIKGGAGKAGEPARGSTVKPGEPVRPTAQSWDPTRSASSQGQETSGGNISSGKDPGGKSDIKIEHDIKIKKKE